MSLHERHKQIITLDEAIAECFSKDELEALTFDLDVNQAKLTQGTRAQFARSIVAEMRRHNRMSQLRAYCQEQRPEVRIEWEILPALPAMGGNNRDKFLRKMDTYWVENFLDKSLYQIARLELGLDRSNEWVKRPWMFNAALDTDPTQSIDPQKSMIEIVQDVGDSLLIVGQPGTGKTTMLAELARELLWQARENIDYPIPTILNLSTWNRSWGNLENWMIEELTDVYKLSRSTAAEWIKQSQFFYLLDGLDEVKREYQNACISAINQFRASYGDVGVVVTCRSEEYAALDNRLEMGGSITLSRLTNEQVDQYLIAAGQPLSAVRTLLNEDNELRGMAQTPLFLSVMLLAYPDATVDDLQLLDTEDRRHHLFSTYVQRMFNRRKGEPTISMTHGTQILAWVARQMRRESMSIFHIEKMQPNWLENNSSLLRYHLTIVFITTCLGLIIGLAYSSIAAWFVRSTPIYGIVGGIAGGGIVGVLLAQSEITLVDRLTFGMPHKTTFKRNLKRSIIWGGLIGISYAIFSQFVVVLPTKAGVIADSIIKTGYVLLFAISLGILSSFVHPLEIENREKPNQGIYNSGVRFILTALLTTLLFGSFALIGDLDSSALLASLLFLLVAYGFGGGTVIQHTILRLYLFQTQGLPFRLPLLLDEATNLIFMRKVGGGYSYIHPLIKEYFEKLR